MYYSSPLLFCLTFFPISLFCPFSFLPFSFLFLSFHLFATSLFPSILVFHFLCLCPSLLSLPLYIPPEAFCQLSWKWTERYPTRLMPATLHCTNNSRTTRNAYMSCTRLPRCQITALALDRQEQKNKTLLISPHAHTHLKTSGQTRLLSASAADGICFRRVRLRGSVSRKGVEGQRGEMLWRNNLQHL